MPCPPKCRGPWLLLALFVGHGVGVAARSRVCLNEGWRFYAAGSVVYNCTERDFAEDLRDHVCDGGHLTKQAQVFDEAGCRETCCVDTSCEVWQWCPGGSAPCGSEARCMTGTMGRRCRRRPGWVSRSRKVAPRQAETPGHACASPYCAVDHDDSAWQSVDLPHDMVVVNRFSVHGDKMHGYLPYSKGWYRLRFRTEAAAGQSVWIDFDGVFRNSRTYLNGKMLGSHPSGYVPFRYDISEVAIYGGENVLAVSVDSTEPDGWWYDGGGIYRHVWLTVAHPVHVAPWGVYLPAKVLGPISAAETAASTVFAQIEIQNDLNGDADVNVQVVIRDPEGTIAAQATKPLGLKAKRSGDVSFELAIPEAQLWSEMKPRLYSCETTVLLRGSAVDSVHDTFGIRKLEWHSDRGFELNSRPVKLKGFCNHQDFAGVGVAVPDSLQGFRVHMLKQMGANAWRTAHNPPSPALLQECDRQGLLVMDENHRNRATSDNIKDLTAMILRDRNHPSIILWSLCNEALCSGFDANAARTLKSTIERLDPLGQRPVTAGMDQNFMNEFGAVLDVMGFNYRVFKYDEVHSLRPLQPMLGSEIGSEVSDRGVYKNDTSRRYVTAYDTEFPWWANTAQDAWCAVEERRFIAGGFHWTGFDYKGEPTPHGWPNVNSHFGVLDIAGFPKDTYYYYQSVFFTAAERPVLHVLPHWSWGDGCQGDCQISRPAVEVWAYTNLDSVELTLNGRSLGRKPSTRCRHVSWQVPFEAGELRAEARSVSSDVVLLRRTVPTAGSAAAISMEIEWPLSGVLQSDGLDVSLITVKVVDAGGMVVPTASTLVRFKLSGPGKLIGLGNGDPSSHEADKPESPTEGSRSAWNGLARLVVQSTRAEGSIVLEARATGLQSAVVSISSRRADGQDAVRVEPLGRSFGDFGVSLPDAGGTGTLAAAIPGALCIITSAVLVRRTARLGYLGVCSSIVDTSCKPE